MYHSLATVHEKKKSLLNLAIPLVSIIRSMSNTNPDVLFVSLGMLYIVPKNP